MHEHSVANRRQPAVAGSFYPADAQQLRASLQSLLQDCPTTASGPVKAIIAPHAGYIYSGHTAAMAYKTLLAQRAQITRVVLIGPAHRVGFEGIAIPASDFFTTPLGDVVLDRAQLQPLETLQQVNCIDHAHTLEHSLEVHLPFLQYLLGQFSLIPLLVGSCTPQEVAEVIDTLWGSDETLFVISSDLSHFHPYPQAQQRDQRTSHAILNLDQNSIGFEDACGRIPIRGLLIAARQHGIRPQLMELCNSGDTAGSRDRVVGYGAFVFAA